MNNDEDQILTTKQAAAFLGIKESTLMVWLSTKRYPIKSLKIGRLRRYRLSDLKSFLRDREQLNTDPKNKPKELESKNDHSSLISKLISETK